MPIYTGDESKQAGAQDSLEEKQGGQYPLDVACSAWGRLEPLITVDQLKSRFLIGIPLTLKVKDPETGKFFRITDDQIKDRISVSVGVAEEETQLTIMPTQFIEKLPFQRQDWANFAFFKLEHRPVASVEALNVALSDGSVPFSFPPMWLELSNASKSGQINVIPLAFQAFTPGTGVVGQVGAYGGATFFNAIISKRYIAALFTCTYTAGFKDGLVPTIVNELIGTIAAMEILSMIGAAYAGATSTSLGIDGMSQSVSTPGPERYSRRMEELDAKRKLLTKKLRGKYNTKIVSGTI